MIWRVRQYSLFIRYTYTLSRNGWFRRSHLKLEFLSVETMAFNHTKGCRFTGACDENFRLILGWHAIEAANTCERYAIFEVYTKWIYSRSAEHQCSSYACVYLHTKTLICQIGKSVFKCWATFLKIYVFISLPFWLSKQQIKAMANYVNVCVYVLTAFRKIGRSVVKCFDRQEKVICQASTMNVNLFIHLFFVLVSPKSFHTFA